MHLFAGKIYVVGGNDGQSALNSIEIYDPEAHTWYLGPSLAIQRANVGVAVLNDKLYAVGGFNGKKFLNSIEFLDLKRKEYWRSIIPKDEETICQQNGGVVVDKQNGGVVVDKQNGGVVVDQHSGRVVENGVVNTKTGDVIENGDAEVTGKDKITENGGQSKKKSQARIGKNKHGAADLKQELKLNGGRNS